MDWSVIHLLRPLAPLTASSDEGFSVVMTTKHELVKIVIPSAKRNGSSGYFSWPESDVSIVLGNDAEQDVICRSINENCVILGCVILRGFVFSVELHKLFANGLEIARLAPSQMRARVIVPVTRAQQTSLSFIDKDGTF